MCMLPSRIPRTMMLVEAAGHTYKQGQYFTYVGGAIPDIPDMPTEIVRWTRAWWIRIRPSRRELYDQPKETLSSETRMIKSEAIEAVLYGFSARTLCQKHYSKRRTVQHWILFF